MSSVRKGLITTIFILAGAVAVKLKAQQTPLYSQYLFNMTSINPAYAGDTSSQGVNLVYRRQWVGIQGGIKGSPKTFTATWLHNRDEEKNVGFGFQVYNDKIGIENSTGLQGFYSYRLKFNNSSLTLGLAGGVVNYRANFASVQTLQPSDPAFMRNVNGWLPTAGAGLVYEREKWFVSFAAPALLRTKLNSEGKSEVTAQASDNHYFLTTGIKFSIAPDVYLRPSVSVKAVSGAPAQFDFNLIGDFYHVCSAGISYRTGDEYVMLLQLKLNRTITMGYSYDYITALGHFDRSAHEVMFKFKTKK